MPKDLVKWVALAACVYILIYVSMHLIDDGDSNALPLFFALMAFGTLAAGLRAGAGACVAAGGLSTVLGTIQVATHLQEPGTPFAISYVIAGLVTLGAGVILMRRPSNQGPDTTA